MEAREFFASAELLNLAEVRRKRPDWLPYLIAPPTPAVKPLVRWYWSYLVPTGIRELYTNWIVSRRYRRNIADRDRPSRGTGQHDPVR